MQNNITVSNLALKPLCSIEESVTMYTINELDVDVNVLFGEILLPQIVSINLVESLSLLSNIWTKSCSQEPPCPASTSKSKNFNDNVCNSSVWINHSQAEFGS